MPDIIWLALGLALGAAAAAGAIALRTSRRVRLRAGQLAAAAAAAQTDSLTEALAYLDVRGLKALNDSEGHPVGDDLLKEVAQLLKESARDGETFDELVATADRRLYEQRGIDLGPGLRGG